MQNHKGQDCPNKPITCQEGVCSDCQIYLDRDSLLVCRHCGLVGINVRMKSVYVGGQGYVSIPFCVDRVSCWERYDQQNGLPANFSLEEVKR